MKNNNLNKLLALLVCTTVVGCNNGRTGSTGASTQTPLAGKDNAATSTASESTVRCDDIPVGGVAVVNNTGYLVVDDGEGAFGIRNKGIHNGIVNGSLRVCTSHVKTMFGLFIKENKFNQPIGDWDTSNVTNMNNMFDDAKAFNQNLSLWNVKKVSNYTHFNDSANPLWVKNIVYQPVWNSTVRCDILPVGVMFVANNTPYLVVEDGEGVFGIRNQDIHKGIVNGNLRVCTSHVKTMSGLFINERYLNPPIDDWDTSNVVDMEAMFAGVEAFNQPIGNWNTSNVRYMNSMFSHAYSFNQPIANWDTGNVVDMEHMFNGAHSFNQPIGNWDTSNVRYMNGMFSHTYSFNQNLSLWNVKKIRNYLAFNDSANPLWVNNIAYQPVWVN